MALSSCLKSNDDNAASQLTVPSGTFGGQFYVVHRKSSTTFDTTNRTNLILTISKADGYKITGDTSVNHAGSYGDFSMNYSQIQFLDQTMPKSGTLTKAHLSGIYNYTYDGTKFFMYNTTGDTVSVQYNFKRTN
ncbi:hypothetical protein [Mucilaginibacter agri]|uniref:Uncharacterized protein n=1 Tax=Mucilaginibacter agri TaxID=2695265 RepID=A0A965ZCU3_9SPHI|nr:hypothetical protein [Mucilaginibacter agri]NCD67933.1 hypothetical protein [Mucilaginibacter agri]